MIERYFTKAGQKRTESKEIDICLKDAEGDILFEQKGCIFPKDFSQTACNIIASKYFYRGAEENNFYKTVDRMVTFWEEALLLEDVLTEDEAEVFYDEITYLIENQMWAPNSPQWFNTGVTLRYPEAKNDDGLYFYDEMRGEVAAAGEDSIRTQASACYILSIEDKLIGKNSISDHYVTETKLFKAGSGCGTNFSPLRAKGERLSGGGTSSGLMSYLKGLDVNAGTIKSGGTTRRAAKMVIVDVDHPEIEAFIDWKVKEEEKAKALIKAGYDGSIGGEAYSTVSGQNSNNTVRIPDWFMDRLRCATSYSLEYRVDPKFHLKSIDYIFKRIAEAAWACGDPGIQFEDTINEWNTCPESGKINASNPCGEFVFLDNTACNLSSINLEKFITKDNIDLDGLYQTIRLAQLAMEASIFWGEYPTEEIAKNSYAFRPTGLGITGLAGALENLELAYDTEEARLWAAGLCSFITASSYEISSEMAKRVGPFLEYEKNRRAMQSVLIKHMTEAQKIPRKGKYLNRLLNCATVKWDKVITESKEDGSGFRNAQVTCIAPTGTISLAMDATSTGVEPYFSRSVTKKLVDGQTIEQTIEASKTADEIAPIDHVKMVAAIQPHISGAVSKTVNLPNSATVEDIMEVFDDAYLLGCKSITVYRDGSKGTQVLERDKKPVKETKSLERKKPPAIRESRTHSAMLENIELYITVGYYEDGSVAEVFVNTDKEGEVVNGLLISLSKTISHLLQRGVAPREVARIIRGQKYEPRGVVARHPNIKMADSISDLIARVIELEDGDYTRIQVKPDAPDNSQDGLDLEEDKPELIYGESCPNCGSTRLIKSGACAVCSECGTSTGCS